MVFNTDIISSGVMRFKNTLHNWLYRNKKVLLIVGPTASGKSSLAITIAQKYNGEIISCDSRQIYQGLEIFSGAVTPETSGGVTHHLVSHVPPGDIYSSDRFVQESLSIIKRLHKQNKLPIVVGGTGFWAQTLLFEQQYPAVSPDYPLRETLEKHTTEELFNMLHKQDPRRATLADPHNKKRLIRALEIIHTMGHVPPTRDVSRRGYSFRIAYLQPEKELLDARITNNVSQRMRQGLLKESKQALLHVSRKQIEELGLGFKNLFDLNRGEITETEFAQLMVREEIRYAKRQKTFFKKLYWKFHGKKVLIHDIDPEKRMRKISSLL